MDDEEMENELGHMAMDVAKKDLSFTEQHPFEARMIADDNMRKDNKIERNIGLAKHTLSKLRDTWSDNAQDNVFNTISGELDDLDWAEEFKPLHKHLRQLEWSDANLDDRDKVLFDHISDYVYNAKLLIKK